MSSATTGTMTATPATITATPGTMTTTPAALTAIYNASHNSRNDGYHDWASTDTIAMPATTATMVATPAPMTAAADDNDSHTSNGDCHASNDASCHSQAQRPLHRQTRITNDNKHTSHQFCYNDCQPCGSRPTITPAATRLHWLTPNPTTPLQFASWNSPTSHITCSAPLLGRPSDTLVPASPLPPCPGVPHDGRHHHSQHHPQPLSGWDEHHSLQL
jgi:hypothetical protein